MKNTWKADPTKRTQKDYSLSFKLQVIDEVEKGFELQAGTEKIRHTRQVYRFGMVAETW